MLDKKSEHLDVIQASFEIDIKLEKQQKKYSASKEKGSMSHSKDSLSSIESGNETPKTTSPESVPMNAMPEPSPINDSTEEKKGHATIIVNSLQLAILARQSSIVDIILSNTINSTPSSEEQLQNDILQILKSRIRLDLRAQDRSLIQSEGLSLEGMNIFHLSCQYHPESLKVILDRLDRLPLNIRKNISPDINKLLNDSNNDELRYTPLHIATRGLQINAVR